MDLILPDFGLLVWTGIVFSLLLFLLAKFAWKPILNAVNTREEKIAEALELAEKTKAEIAKIQSEIQKNSAEASNTGVDTISMVVEGLLEQVADLSEAMEIQLTAQEEQLMNEETSEPLTEDIMQEETRND